MDERDAVRDINDDADDDDDGEDLFAEEFEECVSTIFLRLLCSRRRTLFTGLPSIVEASRSRVDGCFYAAMIGYSCFETLHNP